MTNITWQWLWRNSIHCTLHFLTLFFKSEHRKDIGLAWTLGFFSLNVNRKFKALDNVITEWPFMFCLNSSRDRGLTITRQRSCLNLALEGNVKRDLRIFRLEGKSLVDTQLTSDVWRTVVVIISNIDKINIKHCHGYLVILAIIYSSHITGQTLCHMLYRPSHSIL